MPVSTRDCALSPGSRTTTLFEAFRGSLAAVNDGVMVGARNMQSAFRSVTAHEAAVIGGIGGDRRTAADHDLGRFAWSAVKEALSGVRMLHAPRRAIA